MPKSKTRKKAVYTPPQKAQTVKVSPRWLAPLMVACWIVGIVWIAVYYIVPDLPGIATLGNGNLLVGFGLIIVGVVLSTKWR
ncbi:cell division protein CrgA [Sphaerimonospora cavernae]|uniref:Cell division protein CrgA n=1 Tax=Sphaerimonospora cavernae TaxID=1740611 RepID=A0ABV6UA53_9ACTN